jgi:hypothetical protein
VRIIPDTDGGIERWINGVAVVPYPTDGGFSYDASTLCPDVASTPDIKEDGAQIPLPEFSPITVYEPITCTTVQVGDQAAFRARAVTTMAAVEGRVVENELLTGSASGLVNPFLADGNGTFPNLDVATTAVEGLGLLEDEIAASGRQGLIHASPAMAARLHFNQVVELQNGVWRTVNGTVLIPGQGYAGGASPAGHAAATGTEEWMYASGPVDVRRSDVFTVPEDVSQAVDRELNIVTYRAERYYLADWDTAVQAAVLVDRCLIEC